MDKQKIIDLYIKASEDKKRMDDDMLDAYLVEISSAPDYDSDKRDCIAALMDGGAFSNFS